MQHKLQFLHCAIAIVKEKKLGLVMLSVFRNRNDKKDVAQLGLIGLFTCLLHPTKQGF